MSFRCLELAGLLSFRCSFCCLESFTFRGAGMAGTRVSRRVLARGSAGRGALLSLPVAGAGHGVSIGRGHTR